jgi:hypothetical protein
MNIKIDIITKGEMDKFVCKWVKEPSKSYILAVKEDSIE